MKIENATSSEALQERINQNLLNQSIDMNEWAFNLIEKSDTVLNVLELCCGTGKQTKKLVEKFKNSHLTCVDISSESLEAIKKSTFYEKSNINLVNDSIDEFCKNNKSVFDVVFVSYGLYYAKDIENVLLNIFASLKKEGRFIILGPYGENNKQLFDLITSVGIKIDDFVKYSSTDFMYGTVLRRVLNVFDKIVINMVVNEIKWNSPQEVMNYWENSTFFDAHQKDVFLDKINDYFLNNSNFINEKHIMLLNCINKK